MEQMEMTNNVPPKPNGSGTGPVIAIIVIVILFVLGGLYYLTQGVPVSNESGTADQDQKTIAELMAQGSSDTAAAIQADVNATDLKPVDDALSSVDKDLQP